MRRGDPPEIEWRAVVPGLALGLAIGWLVWHLAPNFGLAASILGVASGAFLAGKRAFRFPVYQGALVGAGYLVAEAIGLLDGTPGLLGSALADTAATITRDVALLVLAAAASRLARASSSSDTGRGR